VSTDDSILFDSIRRAPTFTGAGRWMQVDDELDVITTLCAEVRSSAKPSLLITSKETGSIAIPIRRFL